jgi:uncharacterized membrane protein
MDAQFPNSSSNLKNSSNHNSNHNSNHSSYKGSDKDFSKGSDKSYVTITNIIYLLQAIAVFTAFPFFIAVIINYVTKEDVKGTLAESHFRWQIRTFWYSLLWGVIGAVLVFFLIGYAILFVNYVWVIYRIIKGWLSFNNGQAMYT